MEVFGTGDGAGIEEVCGVWRVSVKKEELCGGSKESAKKEELCKGCERLCEDSHYAHTSQSMREGRGVLATCRP
jgi:hypothetical protein